MKVYVACCGEEFDPTEILGCYTTQEKADARCVVEKNNDIENGQNVDMISYFVESFDLDEEKQP